MSQPTVIDIRPDHKFDLKGVSPIFGASYLAFKDITI